MKKYGKTDLNQNEIVKALRQVGAKVTSTASIGGGFPDIVVIYRGKVYLFEIKQKGEWLTDDQQEWWAEAAQVDLDVYQCVVFNIEEALSRIGAI